VAEGGGRRRAYIGSFTAAGGPGIVTATVSPDTGALKTLGALKGVPDPSYLALSADREVLYAVSETAEGAVAAYRVTGERPEPAGPPVPVEGTAPPISPCTPGTSSPPTTAPAASPSYPCAWTAP
jgi:hypothetical protein